MSGEAILVIDDNPQNLKLARVLLSIEGYEVMTAVDAEQALQIVEARRPRLILLDVQLPRMDGLALARRLKADPRYRDTVIIAVTAYAMKEDEENARAAGCDDYMAKPIDTRLLPQIVARHLRPRPGPA